VNFLHPIFQDVHEDREVVLEVGAKELRPISRTSKGLRYNYIFATPRAKVTAIVVRARKYEWLELKNVAFAPTTQPTQVKVAAAAAAKTEATAQAP
jgi:hypothetical protein